MALTAIQIAVGDELLRGDTADTNTARLARVLADRGIQVREHWTVADRLDELVQHLKRAAALAQLVVVTGGLGATDDDHTRQAMAAWAAVPLCEAAPVRATLEAAARRRGRPLGAHWLRQALVPAGAELLPNPAGLAPGLWLEAAGAVVVALPGVPREVEAIVEAGLASRWAGLPDRAATATRVVRLAGAAESDVNQALVGEALDGCSIAYLPHPLVLDVCVRGTGAGAAERVEAVAARLALRIDQALPGSRLVHPSLSLPGALLRVCRARGVRLAVAESCTGGLVAKLMTDEPGASAVFAAGFVPYANAQKEALGVPATLLATHGAVSAEVAAALAGAARRAVQGPAVGLAVTGIAGPGGATETKPVGLVFVGVVVGGRTIVRRLELAGNRRLIRLRSAARLLDLARRVVTEQNPLDRPAPRS